jgi:hypothetical protein
MPDDRIEVTTREHFDEAKGQRVRHVQRVTYTWVEGISRHHGDAEGWTGWARAHEENETVALGPPPPDEPDPRFELYRHESQDDRGVKSAYTVHTATRVRKGKPMRRVRRVDYTWKNGAFVETKVTTRFVPLDGSP